MATEVVGETEQGSAISHGLVMEFERAEAYRLGRANQCLLWVTGRAQFEREHEIA